MLLLLALLLRVGFLLLAGINAPLTGDELAYQQIAENFAHGLGLFQTNNPFFPGQILYSWQAPLYPLALGVLYKLIGVHILAAKFFGILISTAMVYVVYDLAYRVFRSTVKDEQQARRIAIVSGVLTAIYPGLLTNAHLLLSETFFTFLLVLALDLAARGLEQNDSRQWVFLAGSGAVWSLATLTRGLTLYFTPLFALWIGYVIYRGQMGAVAGGMKGGITPPLRAAITSALVFCGAAVIVLVPWAVRNYSVFHSFVLLETKGGVNLWLGNSPYTPHDFIRNVWKVGVREPMLNPLPRGELAQDRTAYTLALNYIRAEPGIFLARMPVKFADFWGMERSLIDNAQETVSGGGWHSPAKLGSDLFAVAAYVFIMVLGVAGIIFAREDAWKLVCGVYILYFMTVHLVIFGDGRFHLPLMPLFILYAGWLWVMRRQINYTRSRVGLAGLLILLLFLVWGREAWAAWRIF